MKMGILLGAIITMLLFGAMIVSAEEEIENAPAHSDEVKWIPMESTKYCQGTLTYTEKKVRPGIASAKKEWIGLTAAVYEDVENADGTHGPGEFIGYYEIEDTGTNEKIVNGTCIDIYDPSYESCRKWGRRDVWVVLMKGVG